jgi:3-oxoacyl-[acyl-carrier-protein] synthase II
VTTDRRPVSTNPGLIRRYRPEQRVVVTGVGAISPLGHSADETWRGLLDGRSGIRRIEGFDTSDISVKIAGEITNFQPTDWMDRKSARQMSRFSQFAVATAGMALADACLTSTTFDAYRAGIVLGTGAGGTAEILDIDELATRRGMMKISPFSMIHVQYNIAAYCVAKAYRLLGPSLTVSTACATGAHAIGEGFRLVRDGNADVVVAGGTEHCVFPLVVAGFAVQRATSTRNDQPERASRPFDAKRDGFVIGEGAALLVLESLEHALGRGAQIYAEVLGYGHTNDGLHPISPDPEGARVADAIQLALSDGNITREEVDYINAHAAGTPLGDRAETIAIKRALGEEAVREVAISSSKSMVGHMMGAAGALEAMATVLSVRDQVLHPTINLEYPDPECDLDYVPNIARGASVRVALSNSIGVGGQNACLAFGRFERDPARFR